MCQQSAIKLSYQGAKVTQVGVISEPGRYGFLKSAWLNRESSLISSHSAPIIGVLEVGLSHLFYCFRITSHRGGHFMILGGYHSLCYCSYVRKLFRRRK